MKLFRYITVAQSAYTLITAIWPLIHITSFMVVTGPKYDVWLVKTVGALLIPIALTLLSFLILSPDKRPAMILGGSTAISFLIIDCYYALTDVIAEVYLVDAFIQAIFLLAWLRLALRPD